MSRFNNEVERFELEDFPFHALRHTFTSPLAMSGLERTAIKELLERKTIKMTMEYVHLSLNYLQKSVDKLNDIRIADMSQVK